jgi:hypothetical protein
MSKNKRGRLKWTLNVPESRLIGDEDDPEEEEDPRVQRRASAQYLNLAESEDDEDDVETNAENDVCPSCLSQVRDGENGIQCDGCSRWNHADCEGIGAQEYLRFKSKDQFHWRCTKCKEEAADVARKRRNTREREKRAEKKRRSRRAGRKMVFLQGSFIVFITRPIIPFPLFSDCSPLSSRHPAASSVNPLTSPPRAPLSVVNGPNHLLAQRQSATSSAASSPLATGLMSASPSPSASAAAAGSPRTTTDERMRKKLLRKNDKGETHLHRAAIRGNRKVAEILLNIGIDPNGVDNAGWL